MKLIFSITELSNLTGKSRPSVYKYLNAYEEGKLDDIPFSFIKLIEFMNKPNVNRAEIADFCKSTFQEIDADLKVNEVMTLIKNNKQKIDFEKLKQFIEEEINHEQH